MDVVQAKRKGIFETRYQGYLIRDSTSSWAPEPHALGNYGIPADNTPLHRYVVIPLAAIPPGRIPDIGKPCTLFFPDIRCINHAIPKLEITDDHICNLADYIVGQLDNIDVRASIYATDLSKGLDLDNHDPYHALRDEHYTSLATEFFFCLMIGEEELAADITDRANPSASKAERC